MSWKNKFIIVFLFLLVLPSAFSAIIVSPSSWDVSANPGGTTSQVFIFSQTSENTTTSLAFTKTGTNSDYLSFNTSTGSISNTNGTITNLSLKATITVPASALTGVFLMKIKYDSSEIPVVLTISENETVSVGKCRLEPFPDSYTIPFVAGSPPVTQSFSVLVSKHCTEEVNIKIPVIVGNTQTKDGLRPLNLIGGSNLGFIEPNDEGSFDIQVDSSNLPSGTYKPQILITGIYKGEQISTKIQFTVDVKQGASPLESSFILPTYLFSSSELSLNNTYTITAQNLNPNFQPFVEQNEYIRGVKVDTSNGWVYSFQPVKIGNTKLKVSTYFSGAPIGDLTEKEIRINYGSATSIGTRMCFQFFTPGNKPLDTLNGGDSVTILVRSTNNDNKECTSNDTQSSIINNPDLFRNGAKLPTNVFTVNPGEITTITASVPGFISIDKIIDVPLNPVSVSFSSKNNEVEVNSPVGISLIPSDSEITINGALVTNLANFTFSQDGIYNIVASKTGYKQNSFDLSVSQELKIMTTEIPNKIKVNEPYLVELNKPAKWTVQYQEKKNASVFVFKEGFQKSIEFTPDRNGIYKVFLRDSLLKEYKVGGLFGITIPLRWFWLTIGGVIIFIFIWKIFFASGSGGNGGQKSGAKYEFDVGDFGS